MSLDVSKIKTALDIIQKIARGSELIQLQSTITDLQQTIYELQDQNLKLREEMVECKRTLDDKHEWDQFLSSVEEYPGPGGAVIFRIKDQKVRALFYCPRCIGNRKKMLLQKGYSGVWTCPDCQASYQVDEPLASHFPEPPENPYNDGRLFRS